MASDLKLTRKRDMAKLRKRMDGDDGFMSAHQIKKVRVLIGQKNTPEWTGSNAEVRRVLLSSFPDLSFNPAQRRAAARWNQAITLVYRMSMPYNHAALEMGITVGALRSMLRNIRRAAKGLRANGTGIKRGLRGRPKSK